MSDIIWTILVMYSLGIILISDMVEVEDADGEEIDPITAAFLWPLLALQIIYLTITGNNKDDEE